MLTSGAAEDLQPSQDAAQLSQASSEEIDAELLGIFLEEANEVLSTIGESLAVLKGQTYDLESLTTIRRSFHTLKGSGRMVGLKDVGEAAWAVEQTLNLWLRLEMGVSEALLGLLEQATGIFSEWVRYLETGEGCAPDPSGMKARAEALRSGPDGGAQKDSESSPAVMAAEPDVAEELTIESIPAEEGLPEDYESSAEVIHVDFPSARPVVRNEDGGFGTSAEESEAEDLLAGADAEGSQPLSGSCVLAEPPEGESLEPNRPEVTKPQQRLTISPALFEIFSEEAKLHLQTLRSELPVLERAESAPTPQNMYRAAHTLAGISATVGLTPINQLGYALEHALLRRDHSETPGSLEALGVIRRTVGELDLMLAALARQQEISVPPGLVDELDGLYPAGVIASSVPLEIPDKGAEDLGEEPSPEQNAPFGALETAGVPEVRPPLVPDVPLLNDELDEQLLPIFLEEAAEINQAISSQLRAWRDDPASTEIVRVLARQMHTLKGSARMAGAMTLGEIAHALETRIGDVAKAGVATAEVIDEIEGAFDSIRQIVERLERGEVPEVGEAQIPDASASGVTVCARFSTARRGRSPG